MRVNLLGLDRDALDAYVARLDEKPFRARQLMRWIHRRGAAEFDAMSDLAKSLRAKLAGRATISAPAVIGDGVSSDGTRKWLLDVGQGDAIETVFIPEDDRGTLCVSSQAGCAVNCVFCSTGKQGFSRNLTTAEIVGQLWWAEHTLRRACGAAASAEGERIISNVVMMGMGEPLQNYEAVLPALRLMLDDDAYGLSRRRVTLSTSGMVPQIDRLAQDCPVALAVSLHAPNDALRDQLVPLNRKYPLRELLAACQRYLRVAPRDFITFEYVMLDGINDSDAQARELVALVRDVPCKFNLIPFNPFPGADVRGSAPARIRAFAQTLIDAGIVATTRKTRGDDIDAACGQLAGEVRDRTRLAERSRRRPIPVAVRDCMNVLARIALACACVGVLAAVRDDDHGQRPGRRQSGRALDVDRRSEEARRCTAAARSELLPERPVCGCARGDPARTAIGPKLRVGLQPHGPDLHGPRRQGRGGNQLQAFAADRTRQLRDAQQLRLVSVPHATRARVARVFPARRGQSPVFATPAMPLRNAGTCMMQVRDYKLAEEYLRRSFELDAGSAAGKYQLARLYVITKQYDRAGFYYGLLERTVDPTSETIWLGLRIARGNGDSAQRAEARGGSATTLPDLARGRPAASEHVR